MKKTCSMLCLGTLLILYTGVLGVPFLPAQELPGPSLIPEEGGPAPEAIVPEEMSELQLRRLQLAISNANYPVTPGDIYRVSFTTANVPISNELIVESDYTINVGIFGEIQTRGMFLPELKKEIERRILEAYPRSMPALVMTSVGTFEIPVVGEIPETRYVPAWGLSRLSDIVEGVLGRHSSIRDIRIVANDGSWQSYDLWRARFKGDLDQDPFLRPGDQVRIMRVDREIRITGEVFRPGTYQLLEGETFEDIRSFTGGFTPLADPSRITVERFSGAQAELIVLDFDLYEQSFEFKDRDIITVPSKRNEVLQVTVVGAVYNPGRYPFTPPERYMYYLNLAGGVDYERNSGNEVTITDQYGNSRDLNHPIMPGDTITVLNNDFVYNFNRYFPVVTTGMAFILTIIQIINMANQ